MATPEESSSLEQYTPDSDEGQRTVTYSQQACEDAAAEFNDANQGLLRGRKRNHSSEEQSQADFEYSQRLEDYCYERDDEPEIEFYQTHTTTCKYRGYPDAQHPLGHWLEARYDESGNLIPAPRGTFPFLEEIEDRQKAEEAEERELQEADRLIFEAFERAINDEDESIID